MWIKAKDKRLNEEEVLEELREIVVDMPTDELAHKINVSFEGAKLIQDLVEKHYLNTIAESPEKDEEGSKTAYERYGMGKEEREKE